MRGFQLCPHTVSIAVQLFLVQKNIDVGLLKIEVRVLIEEFIDTIVVLKDRLFVSTQLRGESDAGKLAFHFVGE